MRTSDYVADVFGSFRKQRLRTFLTSAGIGIGALAITVMIGLAQGLKSYIEEQFLAFGNERVLMVFPDNFKFGGRILDRLTAVGRPAKRISEEDEEHRKQRRGGIWITPEQADGLKKIPSVESVTPFAIMTVDGIALADRPEEYYEVDFATLSNSPLAGTPSAGRMVEAGEAQAVLLSPQYALSFGLQPDALLGREVHLRVPRLADVQRRFPFRDPTQFKDEQKVFEATVVGLSEKSPASRSVFASFPLGQEMAQYQSGNPDFLSQEKLGFQAHVRVREGVPLEQAKKEIQALGLAARSMNDNLAEIQQVFIVVNVVLTSFGFLALLVATLGIVNTLFMAITERTREIGIMKALGMTDRTVRRLFAFQATAIGLLGGLGGTLAAVALGLIGNVLVKRYVPAAAGLEGYAVFSFPLWLLLGAPLFGMVVGGLAGIYPANRAARLEPIDALRYE